MSSITALLDAYLAAANACDVDAFMALYADDVRVMDAFGSWTKEGKDAWREQTEQWLGEMAPGSSRCRAESIRVDEADELAAVSALVLYSGEDSSGEHHEVWNRWLAVLRRDGDRWLICQEHTSMPLSMDQQLPMP